MIDELRTTLARQAETVRPAPDPYGRLLRLHRRRRRQRRAAIAGGLAVLLILAVPTGLRAGRLLTGPNGPTGNPSPLLRALLDSPTRGSLAGDTGYLEQMRRRAAAEGNAGLIHSGNGLPTDAARVRVLFAGDMPDGRRLVLVAGYSAVPVQVQYTGPSGARPDRLTPTGSGTLDPVVNITVDDNGPVPGGVALVLAPIGSQVGLSDTARYLADGSTERSYTPQPDGYVLRLVSDLPAAGRVRVMYDKVTLYEAPLHRVLTGATATVDPNPLYGRGKPVPVAAQQVADLLARTTGLTSPPCLYEVLWSDQIPMAGLDDSSTAIIATVWVRTPDGGGPYATWAFDPANPTASARTHPSGDSVLGDPEKQLIAMRLPFYSGTGPTQTLQIIAPPSAVGLKVLRDGNVVDTAKLTKGIGQVNLLVPSVVTLMAYDSDGGVVAQTGYTDDEGLSDALYEPTIKGW